MNVEQVYLTDPDICSGILVFAGTRVPVQSLFDHLEGGESIDNFLEGFQSVRRQQVIAVLKEARREILKSAQIETHKIKKPGFGGRALREKFEAAYAGADSPYSRLRYWPGSGFG